MHSRRKEKADFRQRSGNFTESFERFRVMVRHDVKEGRQCFRNGFTQEIKSKKSFRTGQLFLYAGIGHNVSLLDFTGNTVFGIQGKI